MAKLKIRADQIKVRPADPEKDLNFILATWLKSYRGSEFARAVPSDIYYAHHQILIGNILKHPNNSITVLCDSADNETIVGYCVYNMKLPLLFYTYVKFPFRGLGLGRYLFEGVRTHFKEITGEEDPWVTCTHKCRRWGQASKKFKLSYNPYVIADEL